MFRRRRSHGIGILLLAAQLMQTGLQYIPPVTLGIIALNTAVYLRLFNGLPSIRQACISYVHVWYGRDWKRIVLSPFFHLDDLHLYYNMVSFLWKGMSIETRVGSTAMLYLISVFTVLTSATLLILDYCLSILLNDLSYLHTCAAGFSGVIFALKVVTTYNVSSGSMSNVFLFQVPTRIAYWVELVVIQLLLPSTSFTGHLAGIIVGLLYVKGPLKNIMESFGNMFNSSHPVRNRPSYTYHSGTAGGRRSERDSVQDNNDGDDVELQAALQESLNEARERQSVSSYSDVSDVNQENPLTSEEIRQRRLRRFQN